MVTNREVESSPEQIKAILNLQPPFSTKYIKRLADRVTTINKFVYKASKRCKPFYEDFRKNKRF